MKVDVLALRMHEDGVDLLAEQKGVKVDRATILARTRAPMP
jgi:hypothetical protein